jgi:predicted 3-demethylubiquinone-9 3-methyltransferase (glyoxalase superfamily)
VNSYTAIFENSEIVNVTRYGEAGAEAAGRPKGTAMTVTFVLAGQEFTALNAGPHFKFTEAISYGCVSFELEDRQISSKVSLAKLLLKEKCRDFQLTNHYTRYSSRV